ncbi:alpha/beta fold hydrolase [Legionella sp.]|uniref:alpha/beta fold hydrolase n=1 Tax=Legionella sp. TaxID=459 RepID=UPI003CB16691
MPHMKINDISLYYELHGQGEPIVFIGGFTADHNVWGGVVAYFKEKYQVILLDNRGAGQTDVPDGPYSIEQMADDVAALCLRLNINNAHFVGSSMGGYIVQSLSVRYSDLVKSIIICNSGAVMHTTFRLYIEAQLEMRKAKLPEGVLIKAECSWAFSFQFISQPGMLELLIQMGLKNPYPFTDKGYEGQYAALLKFDSSPWLQQIKVPTLVLAGDQDLIFSEFLVKQLANQIKDAKYYCFSKCGHLPQIEYPEQFARVVIHFLELAKP